MSMEITFELSDTDLEYFNKVMLDAREKSGDLDEATVIANARKLLVEVSHSDTSDFIRERMNRLETLIGMVVDSGGGLEKEERNRVLEALAYFSEPEDLIPDDIPGLGFLDDAIMIELVVRELKHEIEAYSDVCESRSRMLQEQGHAANVSSEGWLDTRSKELQVRMRRRRKRVVKTTLSH